MFLLLPLLIVFLTGSTTALAHDVQLTRWLETTCAPALDVPESDRTTATLQPDQEQHLATLEARGGDEEVCTSEAVQVYALRPVWLAATCDDDAELHVRITTSPWSDRAGTVAVFQGSTAFSLPYWGDGPYHTLRLAVVDPTPDGRGVQCTLTAMSADTRMIGR